MNAFWNHTIARFPPATASPFDAQSPHCAPSRASVYVSRSSFYQIQRARMLVMRTHVVLNASMGLADTRFLDSLFGLAV